MGLHKRITERDAKALTIQDLCREHGVTDSRYRQMRPQIEAWAKEMHA